VLKLYPGRLHIAVTERNAFALWQKDGKVAVISSDGAIVEPFVEAAFAKLPLVVGIGAETRAKKFLAELDKHPLIRNQMRAAVLVAERRWNVVLSNGIDVRLPEDDIDRALTTLVKLDRDDKLLTRDIAAIDLRLPDRVTVKLSEEAAAARAEALKARFPKKKGGAA
jgi:cell division protein FtsQ